MSKTWPIFAVFGLALVACSNSNGEFSYSESELKEATLGTWQGSAEVDGETVEFSLVLEQPPTKSKKQSPATTTVPVVGTLTSVNPALNGAVDGQVQAGKDLIPADLSVRLEDGKQLSGAIEKQSLSDGSITSKVRLGTFSLSRP